ncbi:MAG: HEPN domain-containing protein [Acidobacteriota bacterium]
MRRVERRRRLLCSHLEGFFEDLVLDILRFHELNETQINNLPLRLRIVQLWRHLDLVEKANDQKKWAVIQSVRNSTVADETLKCEIGMFDLEIHIKDFANPGSKEVEKLFHNAGIDDIWNFVEARGSGSKILKTSLDSLVHRRNQIAHGDAGATATPNDVKQLIIDMRRLTKVFDLVIADYLSACSTGSYPWDILV